MATKKAKGAAPVRTVKCPQCGASVEWGPQSPYRPFCSARCRQLDLGAWASDAYRVPGGPPDPGQEPQPD